MRYVPFTVLCAVLCAAILSLVACPTGMAAEYLPLIEGNRWTYKMTNGMEMTVKVTGFAEIKGIRCASLETSAGGQTSQEYIAADAEGVRAYKLKAGGQEIMYNPPILRIKLPFKAGDAWSSTMIQGGMTVQSNFRSLGIERVATEAGSFDCIKIETVTTMPDGSGQIITTGWYASGVGLVQMHVQTGGGEMTFRLTETNVRPGNEVPTHAAEVIHEGGEPPPLAPEARQTRPPAPTLEKYQSRDGRVMLFRPKGWKVEEGEKFGKGIYSVSVMEPKENALVLFASFPVQEEIKDSVALAGKFLEGLGEGEGVEDLKVVRINSSPDRSRTIAELTLRTEGKKGMGHAYFFHTQRLGSVYLLLAREEFWNQLRETLTTIAANLAFAPEGVEEVLKQGQKLAQEDRMPEGRVLSPAAMIQEASKKPGKKLPLVEVALPDQSMTLQVPQGWTLQGQEAKYIIYDNPQTKTRGVGSERHTIMPTDLIMPGMQIPGTITTPYQPPPQAFQLLLNSGQIGRDPEILGQYPAEQATPTMAQIFRTMQAQGSQVDMRLLHVRFTSLATGQKLRGLFTVTCLARPMTPVWQCLVHGGWALDGEFDEYLPLYLRILDTARLNQAFANQYVAQGAARQQQLNRNLQKSIAEAGHAFDRYMDSLQNASRSRDYSSWAWSQTTLGQGTWVAENEGSRVYQTDSWGIQGPEGRADAPAYNTTNFTGESPWGGHLDQINTRGEYEKYIRNAR
jgi:hypothetical protein